MTPRLDIITYTEQLFADKFGPSFAAQKTFLKALYKLPMDALDTERFRYHTGRLALPKGNISEAWGVCGRRVAKSLFWGAHHMVWRAAVVDNRPYLAPGELAHHMLLAGDKKQATIDFRYTRGLIASVPMLEREIVRETQETIEFANGNVIGVHVNSHRTVRGYTAAMIVCDEVAHWPVEVEGARSDIETVRALRPTLMTIPNSLLLGFSTPYARKGVLWEMYSRHWGREDSDVLIWRGTTQEMNPTIPQSEIDRAIEEDESAARAEYLAEFRNDVETFIGREAIAAATIRDRWELPPSRQHTYTAFCDPSGGGGRDSMTMAIAHVERGLDRDVTVLDLVREIRPPFSPEAAVEQFVDELRRYRCRIVVGDRFGGTWPAERFHMHGVSYVPSRRNRSELYLDLLPELMSGRIELLDHSRLLSQLRGLERHTSRIGKDTVDHARNSHDDVANAVAGALVEARHSSFGVFIQGDVAC